MIRSRCTTPSRIPTASLSLFALAWAARAALVFCVALAVFPWAFGAAAFAQAELESPEEVESAVASGASSPASFNPDAAAEKALLDEQFPWYGPEGLQRLAPPRRREINPGAYLPFAELMGWSFLFLSLLGLAAAVYFVVREWGGGSVPVVTRVARETGRTIDRVEALPAGLEVEGPIDFLAEVRKAASSGDFNRAVVYLYGWKLLELDRAHIVRLVKGKTNRQYLRETIRAAGPELGASLQQTLEAFESVYFGGRRLTRELFDPLWNRIPEFQRLTTARPA